MKTIVAFIRVHLTRFGQGNPRRKRLDIVWKADCGGGAAWATNQSETENLVATLVDDIADLRHRVAALEKKAKLNPGCVELRIPSDREHSIQGAKRMSDPEAPEQQSQPETSSELREEDLSQISGGATTVKQKNVENPVGQ